MTSNYRVWSALCDHPVLAPSKPLRVQPELGQKLCGSREMAETMSREAVAQNSEEKALVLYQADLVVLGHLGVLKFQMLQTNHIRSADVPTGAQMLA